MWNNGCSLCKTYDEFIRVRRSREHLIHDSRWRTLPLDLRVLKDSLRWLPVVVEVGQLGDDRSWPTVRERVAVGGFYTVGISIFSST